jgi:hypothetical protein
MKYIITESRLNDIIEGYLNSELGDLKLVNINEKTDWYVNKSGKPLVINEFIFDGFMVIILGSFGIASVDKFMNIKNGKKKEEESNTEDKG